MANTRDDITRSMLNRIRSIQENSAAESEARLLNEEIDNGSKDTAIAITDDPKFGQNVLTNQIEQFRASVEGGAQFMKPEECKLSECPLIYLRDSKNLVFSGVIPSLNNLKWQFVLKTSTGNGCFLWSDGLILNKDNLQVLNKLWGFYKNWVEQWNIEAADLERMAQNMDMK